jgi:hypothetical protein
MKEEFYLALGSMLIACITLITTFVSNLEEKKIKELEENSRRQRTKLKKALNAIKGYQQIEKKQAQNIGKDVSSYRGEVRKEYSELFDNGFLSPSNINKMLSDLEND